jgi:hypothetical protein
MEDEAAKEGVSCGSESDFAFFSACNAPTAPLAAEESFARAESAREYPNVSTGEFEGCEFDGAVLRLD